MKTLLTILFTAVLASLTFSQCVMFWDKASAEGDILYYYAENTAIEPTQLNVIEWAGYSESCFGEGFFTVSPINCDGRGILIISYQEPMDPIPPEPPLYEQEYYKRVNKIEVYVWENIMENPDSFANYPLYTTIYPDSTWEDNDGHIRETEQLRIRNDSAYFVEDSIVLYVINSADAPYDTNRVAIYQPWPPTVVSTKAIKPVYVTGMAAFPNPFKAFTRITGRGPVKVYDYSGRVVRTVTDFWDGCNSRGQQMPAGTYFISNKANTQKITLLP